MGKQCKYCNDTMCNVTCNISSVTCLLQETQSVRLVFFHICIHFSVLPRQNRKRRLAGLGGRVRLALHGDEQGGLRGGQGVVGCGGRGRRRSIMMAQYFVTRRVKQRESESRFYHTPGARLRKLATAGDARPARATSASHVLCRAP